MIYLTNDQVTGLTISIVSGYLLPGGLGGSARARREKREVGLLLRVMEEMSGSREFLVSGLSRLLPFRQFPGRWPELPRRRKPSVGLSRTPPGFPYVTRGE